jgi:hypothetical protein
MSNKLTLITGISSFNGGIGKLSVNGGGPLTLETLLSFI